MDIRHETETHLFWEEEGILCFKYKVPVVDLDIARNAIAIRAKLTNNAECLVFSDCTLVTNVTSEARTYYASVLTTKTTIALAVLAPNAITKIIAAFFLTFNRPQIPYKFFSAKEKAFLWLHEQREGSKQL